MTVYVDWLMHHGWVLRGHTVKSCHMFADTLEELHAMAAYIGLKRAWFQTKSAAHYDLTESRRKMAVTAGAVELDKATWRDAYKKAKAQLEELND